MGECKLLSGTFAQFLQICIGIFALSSLLYKRHVVEEEPRRAFEVWLMDVSKQIVQSVFMHFGNIALAIVFANLSLSAENDSSHDECAFYFMSFCLDTFLGIQLIYIMLKASRNVAISLNIPALKDQGFYGNPLNLIGI